MRIKRKAIVLDECSKLENHVLEELVSSLDFLLAHSDFEVSLCVVSEVGMHVRISPWMMGSVMFDEVAMNIISQPTSEWTKVSRLELIASFDVSDIWLLLDAPSWAPGTRKSEIMYSFLSSCERNAVRVVMFAQTSDLFNKKTDFSCWFIGFPSIVEPHDLGGLSKDKLSQTFRYVFSKFCVWRGSFSFRFDSAALELAQIPFNANEQGQPQFHGFILSTEEEDFKALFAHLPFSLNIVAAFRGHHLPFLVSGPKASLSLSCPWLSASSTSLYFWLKNILANDDVVGFVVRGGTACLFLSADDGDGDDNSLSLTLLPSSLSLGSILNAPSSSLRVDTNDTSCLAVAQVLKGLENLNDTNNNATPTRVVATRPVEILRSWKSCLNFVSMEVPDSIKTSSVLAKYRSSVKLSKSLEKRLSLVNRGRHHHHHHHRTKKHIKTTTTTTTPKRTATTQKYHSGAQAVRLIQSIDHGQPRKSNSILEPSLNYSIGLFIQHQSRFCGVLCGFEKDDVHHHEDEVSNSNSTPKFLDYSLLNNSLKYAAPSRITDREGVSWTDIRRKQSENGDASSSSASSSYNNNFDCNRIHGLLLNSVSIEKQMARVSKRWIDTPLCWEMDSALG